MWGCSDLAGTGKNIFHPIVSLPEHYWVLNLQRPQTDWANPYDVTIGRYDENRKGMYTQELFGGERTIHVGLDIGAPAQTPIHAFHDGLIHSFADNNEEGSYGPTIITEHSIQIDGIQTSLWVLHGHLSRESLQGLKSGDQTNQRFHISGVGRLVYCHQRIQFF